jgi:hypothetical protein
MATFVNAACGKEVKSGRKNFHERMCTKCQKVLGTTPKGFEGPLEAPGVAGLKPDDPGTLPPDAVELKEPEDFDSATSGVTPTPDKDTATVGVGSPPPASTPPAGLEVDPESLGMDDGPVRYKPPDEDAIVDKVVNKLQEILKANMPVPLTQEQLNAQMDAWLAAKQKVAQEEAEKLAANQKPEVPQGNGNGNQPPVSDPASGLAALAPFQGILQAGAQVISAFKGGGGGAGGMEQFMKMMEFSNEQTRMQLEIFRSGSDFASGIISTSSKLGANPGDAADLVKTNAGRIIPKREPNIPK